MSDSTLNGRLLVEQNGADYVMERIRCANALTPWDRNKADATVPDDLGGELFDGLEAPIKAAVEATAKQSAFRAEGKPSSEIELLLAEKFGRYAKLAETLSKRVFEEGMRQLIVY